MASLNERLLIEGESNAEAGVHQASPSAVISRKRALLGLLAVVGVACVVVGSVAAAGVFSRSSPSSSGSSASSSGQSFSVVDPNLLQRRPSFAAPLGSLANAPEPTIIASTDKTQTAKLEYAHTRVTAQGKISHTQLSYTVEKHRNAHCLAKHESVLAVDCLPNRIRVSFVNSSKAQEYAANWKNETILFLRSEWGCGAHIRQFVQHPVVEGRFLFAWTVNTTFAAAFPQATVSFFTNHTGDEGPAALNTKAHTFAHAAANGRERRSLWDSLVSGVENFIGSQASNLVQFAVTGNLDETMTPFTSSYTIPPTPLSYSDAEGSSVTLTYGGSLSVTSSVNLNVQDYTFQSVSASVSGSLNANTQLNLQTNDQFSSQNSGPLTVSPFGSSGTIDVFGVSVAVSTSVQVLGGYSVQADAAGSLTGTASASGAVYGGISYTPSSGITPVGNTQLSGGLSYPSIDASFGADALAYLTPQVSLQVEYIGGSTASFTVYGEASLPNTCTVTQTIGSQVNMGAELDISIAGISVVQQNYPNQVVSGPTQWWSGSEDVC